MRDSRYETLAKVLVHHAMKVKRGDNALLLMRDPNLDFMETMVQAVHQAGGNAIVELSDSRVQRLQSLYADETITKLRAQFACERMNHIDCSMHFVGAHNEMESCDVPASQQSMISLLHGKPLNDVMDARNVRWVVVQWPTAGAAQKAQMSTEAFEDFFFEVCCADYEKMARDMAPLKELMAQTDRVRIAGQGNDVTFSIKGQAIIPCCGDNNIPDGEIFTSPIKDSMNGVVAFNCPSIEGGFRYENIRLTFKDGKVVDAQANDSKRINEYLDTDEGARYVGEFALGVNNHIKKPMGDTLFDEKIGGSFHMALGNSYQDAPNGNSSAIHWDIVCMQQGGGELYFDEVLVRKDGLFVLPQLQGLNE